MSVGRSRGPDEFFAELRAAFATAAGRLGCFELRHRGARHSVRLLAAGRHIEQMLVQGLARTTPSGPDEPAPDLDVLVLDLDRSGVARPTLPWRPEDVRELGAVRGYNDERFRTLHDASEGRLWLSMVDRDARLAVFLADSEAELPTWMRAAPLRPILHLGLGSATRQLLHGAGVGANGRGLLLAGAGGSGKSTTALACAVGGMNFVGDDYVLLDTSGSAAVHSLFRTAKVNARSLELLPGIESHLLPARAGDDKRVVDVVAACPGRLVPGQPVSAIVMPRLAPGRPTALTPVPGGTAVRALAPSTIFQMAGNGAAALAQMARVAREVPCYELALGDGSPVPVLADLLAA